MSYVENNLIPGERIVYRAHLHWKLYVRWALIWLIGVLILFAGALFRPEYRSVIYLLMLGLTVGIFGWAYLMYRSSEFVVTDKRVVIKMGLINRRTMETLLTQVENISVEQRMMGRLFNYGTIHVTGTGGTTETFPNLAAPLEFRRQVQAGTIAFEERRGGMSSDRQVAAGPSRDERECPSCAERILAKAKVCRFCGREVTPLSER